MKNISINKSNTFNTLIMEMNTLMGLKLKGIYKAYVFEEEECFQIDDFILLDRENNYYHLKIEDNEIKIKKINFLKDIDLIWDSDREYSIGVRLIREGYYDEIISEKKYYQDQNYNYLIEYLGDEDTFLLGLVLGFDEVNVIFDRKYSEELKEKYK